jgi:hypothetical protein
MFQHKYIRGSVLKMIEFLKFKRLNNIELTELTNNTIIMFKTKKCLAEFINEFEKLIKDINYEEIDIKFSNNSCKHIDGVICRDLAGIYNVDNNNQRIIMTVEPISVLSMKDMNDLWFIDKNNGNWDCWDFCSYTNFKNYTNSLDIYKFVCMSEYGCGIKSKNKND